MLELNSEVTKILFNMETSMALNFNLGNSRW